MPCDTQRPAGETPEKRKTGIALALDRLEAALKLGQVKVVIGPQGALTFTGWDQKSRDGVTDLCAYRRLTAKSSAPLRAAIAKAEVASGQKLNPQAIRAGEHSHDGGKTWGHH